MVTLREAAQQALEALNTLKIALRVGMPEYGAEDQDELLETATTALRAALESDDTEMLLRQHRFEIGQLRAALAEPAEPIGVMTMHDGMDVEIKFTRPFTLLPGDALSFYATPTPRKPEPAEPVAWMCPDDPERETAFAWKEGHCDDCGKQRVPLYTAPTPHKPLSAAQAGALWKVGMSPLDFARAIEAKHGITGDSK